MQLMRKENTILQDGGIRFGGVKFVMMQGKKLDMAVRKSVIILIAFLAIAVITLSAMAKADENYSEAIAPNASESILAPMSANYALFSEYPADSSPPVNSSLSRESSPEANETASQDIFNASEQETAENTTSSTLEEHPAAPETAENVGTPLIEASLTTAKVIRNRNFDVQATLRNLGNATANITGIDFSLPGGFFIYSLDYSQCRLIEPGSECSFPAEFSTDYSAKLGKLKIQVLVKYE